jgi:hypothetical protein
MEQAIKDAAKREHRRNPNRSVSDIIRQTYYDRFLCRIFGEEESCEWILKGGSAMLARIPATRRTLDADLFRKGYDLDQSLEELQRLANLDLHDFCYFNLISVTPIGQGPNQPYLDGYRVNFSVRIGVKELDPIHVDLVTHYGALDEVEIMDPKNRVTLVKELETHPYRLYPIVNQISDKICAIVERINGTDSTRIKDLVDLVIILTTQDFGAIAFLQSLRSECGKRRLNMPLAFHIPSSWRDAQFATTALGTLAAPYDIASAAKLVETALGYIPSDVGDDTFWNHTSLQWE